MSTLPPPLPSTRYSLWQPAISAVPATPVSYRLASEEAGREAMKVLPGTSRALFALPGHSPVPLPHLPPPLGHPCLRTPIPLHQYSHQPPRRAHFGSAGPADVRPVRLACSTATPTTTAEVGRELRAFPQAVVPSPSPAGPLIHPALTLPPDIRRPLPLVYNFTASELDSVLYGYIRASQSAARCGLRYAMTGLRINENTDHRFKSPTCPLLPSSDADVKPNKEPRPESLERAPSESVSEKSTSRSLLDCTLFPEGISITQTMVGGYPHYSVFCHSSVIHKGARFGPFTGRIIHPSEIKSNDDTNCMWEIFQDGKLSHFVDGRNSPNNWLCFVNCARHAKEQNLIAAQCGDFIYYEACKDIPKGTELLVWYGDSYRQFMGIPVSLKGKAEDGCKEDGDSLKDKEGYMCDRCGKVFSYKDYRDKHLKYTRCVDKGDRKFPCDLCSRSFEKKDRLRIHILHVHHKHRPHKCTTCGKSFSQSSSLNKHIRVHSGERPYKCVYCSKAFTASSILRTHIRQHSGERPFKCKHCGKAFASHAAHDSHVRRTHGKDKSCVCTVCGKAFSQKCELKFHMNIHPDIPAQLYECDRCNLGFASRAARDQHSLIHDFRKDATPGNQETTKSVNAILE